MDSSDELVDQAWDRVRQRDVFTMLRHGEPVEALPSGGFAAMERDVEVARGALERFARVDDLAMPAADRLTAAFVRDHLAQEVAEAERFWYRFPVTPYNASVLATYRNEVLGAIALTTPEDADRYLALLNDYVTVVKQMGVTLDEQRRRGIVLPAWAAEVAVDTIRGHANASGDLMPAPDRLADRVAATVDGPLAEAFGRLLDELAADVHNGREAAGIGQYSGGSECYAGLIRLHTGLELTADRIHEIGLSEVDRLNYRIRSELGIADEAAHKRRLATGPRIYVAEPAEVERRFQSYIDQLDGHLLRYFEVLPAAPFRLRRLDSSLESGLTYGYYEPPGADGCGYYHYNGSDLANRPLLQAASVIYHEGLPGHHLQLGRLAENTALHPIRREPPGLRTFALNGYLEGWAEYAAGLCEEIGLYDDPLDLYGRLSAERFHAARLVVDTGMNVLGWTRDRAAEYLRANSFLSEVEINTELLRYAVDDPGQALAYHLGHWYLRELRAGREPRPFHEAVLARGPLPLALVGKESR